MPLALLAATCLAAAELAQLLVVSVGGASLPAIWPLTGVLAAALIPPAAGGTIAAALLGAGAYLEVARSWWLAEMLGILLATPLVIAAVAGRHEFAADLKSWKAVEMAILLAVAIAMAQSIFGDGLDPPLRVPAYLLPLLLWPVFRFGPGGTSVAVFVVLSIGLWHAAHGEGPFALTGGASELVLRSQGAGAIAAVSFLLLASIVAERKRVARENVILVAELQQAWPR